MLARSAFKVKLSHSITSSLNFYIRTMSTSSTSSAPVASTSTAPSTSSPQSDAPATAQLLPTSTPSELSSSLSIASSLLHSNLPVAFPTETVYGLGASALSSLAVKRIFAAKGRPSDNPLIVHIGSRSMLDKLLPRKKKTGELMGMNRMYESLIEKFWPGPLSLIFPLSTTTSPSLSTQEEEEWEEPEWKVVPEVTASRPSLCIRMPSHPLALELLKTSNLPLAAPSANLSSRPSPTSARHVMDDLGEGRGVGAVLDGGKCKVGVESTVVDYLETLEGGRVRVLRAGGISQEDIEECLRDAGITTTSTTEGGGGKGFVQVYSRDFKSSSLESNPTTPGMKYKHYSPGNSKVVLVRGVKGSQILPSIQELVQLSCLTQSTEGRRFRVGLMLTHSTLSSLLRSEESTTTTTTTENDEIEEPVEIQLPPPPPSLFAQLTSGEDSNLPPLSSIEILSLPLTSSPSSTREVGEEAASRLFHGLRKFDSLPLSPSDSDSTTGEEGKGKGREGVDLILVECVEETKIGLAVMERARKAAGGIERGGEMEFAL
ncbi:threonylcarbamoyladenylate synthase [Sporobolomyces salmoneus]|uniref:threonylcarbamoyladenylate synthase n=1 Tax=Sporobolomyces salmoneus TaxID=183962 RepID=UPI00317C51F6